MGGESRRKAMALGMNKLKMDSLGQFQDGTSSGWIRRDKLRWNELEMDLLGQTKDGTSSGWIRQDGLPTQARQGAGKGQAFIHPEGVQLWVKPHVVVGK